MGLGILIAACRHVYCRYRKQRTTFTHVSVRLHLLYQLAMNFRLCDTLYAQKLNNTASFRHLATFAVGLPFWYRLQGDQTRLQCPLVTAWQHRQVTRRPLHGEISSRMMLFHAKHAVALFFNSFVFQTYVQFSLSLTIILTDNTNNTNFIKWWLYCNCHRLIRRHSDSKLITYVLSAFQLLRDDRNWPNNKHIPAVQSERIIIDLTP